MADFECPACGHFSRDTLPELVTRYIDSGKLSLAFKHLPLEAIHPSALQAAAAADCAGRAGLFWEMHDAIFLNQAQLDVASLQDRAQKIGLDQTTFDKCLNESDGSEIRQAVAAARALDITATPTFLIGFRVGNKEMQPALRIDGARPLAQFVEALDRATKPFPVREPKRSGSTRGTEDPMADQSRPPISGR